MGGCMGKSSYGPWRNNTPPTESPQDQKKRRKDKLHISIGEGRPAEKTKCGDSDKMNNCD